MNVTRNLHVTAVVLAAGTSSRMGAANKLLLPLDDRPIVVHAVETVRAAPVDEVVVVTGHEREAVEAALAHLPVRCVHNADYASGMASSLRCGVEAASSETDGILIGLGDMPLIRVETLRRLCERFAAAQQPVIVVPVHTGRRGHPVLFDVAFRDELQRLRGDGGARPILQAHPNAVTEVPVDDPGIFRDIDTQAAYDALVRDA